MNTYSTKAQKLQWLRAQAKANGLTFKAVNVSFNGNQGYALFDRVTKVRYPSTYTLEQAFQDQMYSGFMSEQLA